MSLKKTIEKFLKERPQERFTAQQLAEWYYYQIDSAKNEKKLANSKRVTNEQQLVRQYVAEIYARFNPRANTLIKRTEESPRRFYFTDIPDIDDVAVVENAESQSEEVNQGDKNREIDLYAKLVDYMWHEHRVYLKRIDEKTSSNLRGLKGNHWLHPDMVGLQDLSADWHDRIRACVSESKDQRAKLWSFEIKLKLKGSNVRQHFFQAVSNSSWANFGYLVTSDISGDHTQRELEILGAAHGIGVILLNSEQLGDSQILIHARERLAIDWDSCNRLTMNKDFQEYIERVRKFYRTGDPERRAWDAPQKLEVAYGVLQKMK